MKAKSYFLLITLAFILSFVNANFLYSATCTWDGTTSNWSATGSWSCGAAPGTADTATINAGIVTLTANASVGTLNLGGGTLNLNGFTLTVTTATSITGGAINNGALVCNGNSFSISGGIHGATFTVNVGDIDNIQNTTFNGNVSFTKTGGLCNSVMGGNTYNATAAFIMNGACAWTAADRGDVFNGNTTFSVGAGATGRFNIASTTFTVTFNGNVFFSSYANQDLVFGDGGNIAIAAGRAMTVSSGTYTLGNLLIRNVTQSGVALNDFNMPAAGFSITTSTLGGGINLLAYYFDFFNSTIIGDAILKAYQNNSGNNADLSGNTFRGSVTLRFSSSQIQNNIFNLTSGVTNITKFDPTLSGGANVFDLNNGGNTFYGVTTIIDSAGAPFELGNTGPDNFKSDLYLNIANAGDLGIARGTGTSVLEGNLYVTSTCSNTIVIGNFSGAGRAQMVAGKSVLTFGAFSGGIIRFYYFTQLGTTTNIITGTGTSQLICENSTFGGAFTGTIPYVYSSTSTFSGKVRLTASNWASVKTSAFRDSVVISAVSLEIQRDTFNTSTTGATVITKTGGDFNMDNGGNIFNGITHINQSGSAPLMLGHDTYGGDVFNKDVTFQLNSIATTELYPSFRNTSYYNGNIYLKIDNTRSIRFGDNNVTSTGRSIVAAGKALYTDAATFLNGWASITNVTQNGNVANVLNVGGGGIVFRNSDIGGDINFTGDASGISYIGIRNNSRCRGNVTSTVSGSQWNGLTGGANFYLENSTFDQNVTHTGGVFSIRGNNMNTVSGTTTMNFTTGGGTSGDNGANTFNGVTTFNNSCTSGIELSNTPSGDTYNNEVYFNVSSSGYIGASRSQATIYNGNIYVISTGTGNIDIGNNNSGGNSTLANNRSILTPGSYTGGNLIITRVTQSAGVTNAAHSLNLTGTANLTVNTCTFEGNFTAVTNNSASLSNSFFQRNTSLTSSRISQVQNNIFNNTNTTTGTTLLTKTGSTNDDVAGGNTFRGATTITNSGSGRIRFANTSADAFQYNLTLTNTGSSYISMAYAGASTFNNIYVNSTSGSGVYICESGGSGTATVAAGAAINNGSGSFSAGALTIRNLTQNGTAANTFNTTSSADLSISTSTLGGNWTSTITDVSTLASTTFQRSLSLVTSSIVMTSCSTNTVSGTTTIEKNGGANDGANGGNYFGGVTTITHNGNATNSSSTGTIIMDQWTGVGGTSISDIPVNTTPNSVSTLSSFEIPSNTADNYGVRVKGYINAPQTGNYTFWIAGDDAVELWLSTDATEGNKVRIAYHTSWTNSREWTKFGTQQSSAISLVAGQRYYVEALMKEGGGGDNFAVGWQLPDATLERPIPGSRLSPVATTLAGYLYFGVSSRDVFASSATFNENTNNILSVAHNSNGNTFGGTTTFNVINSGTIRIATLSPATSTFNGSSVFNSSNTSSIRVAEGSGTTATFNGNMSFTNTSTLGIYFGNAGSGGNTIVANTYALSNSTFNTGNLSISNFTQTGTGASQLLALTGTSTLTLGPSVNFNALVDFESPQVYLNGGTYNGTTSIEKTGATNNSSNGNNTFNGTTTISNNGTGYMRLAGTNPDNFVGNVTFDGAGTGALQPAYNGQNNFEGNITCNRALVWNGGTGVTYCRNGSVQLISGTTLQTIPRLTIDKSANYLALGFNLTVSNVLTLTQGYLDLNGYEFIMSNSCTCGIVRTGGWIRSERTDNSSKITWRMGSTVGAYVFPFGKNASSYIPFTFNLTSGTIGDVTLATYPTIANNTPYPITPEPVSSSAYSSFTDNEQNMVDRYWQINKTGTGTADITFTYADDEIPSGGEAGLTAQRYSVLYSKWMMNVSTQTQNAAANTVTATGVSTFSPWTLILPVSPLSVKFVVFEAKGGEGSVNLSWEITTPVASSKNYYVERSIDGKEFLLIGNIENSAANNLTFVDNNPMNGYNYYRIKVEEQNGDISYSSIKAAKSEQRKTILKVYPNPTTAGNLNISISTPSTDQDNDVMITVMDLLGRVFYSGTIKMSSMSEIHKLDLEGIISQGVYRISISNGSDNASEVIVIQ